LIHSLDIKRASADKMPTERRPHAENHAVNPSVSQFTWGCQEFAPACLCPCYHCGYTHISTLGNTITALSSVGSCIFKNAPFGNPLAKISLHVRGSAHRKIYIWFTFDFIFF